MGRAVSGPCLFIGDEITVGWVCAYGIIEIMDNDFKYRPPKQRNVPTDSSEDMDTDDTAEASDTSTVPSSRLLAAYAAGPKKGHGFLVFIIMLILLLAAAGGVFYWQHQKVIAAQKVQTSDYMSSQKAIDDLKSQLAAQKAAAAKPATTDYSVVSGAPSAVTVSGVTVSAQFLANVPSEVWVEYGTSPTQLTTASKHVKLTAMGVSSANGSYKGQELSLTGLKAGTQYFYRAAGTVSGKTVYGGVVSFMTK